MSGYQVFYRPIVVEHDLSALPRNMQRRVLRAVESRLLTQPDRYGERLRRSLLGLWKIRVGDYRVIYEIRGRDVHIWAVGIRRDAYDTIARRRQT
ncbi:MAG: type II toxin-antitoxin system RelE/ParE family toxin [Planctomycetes bacterium]|nr:type II toxin-antitoxin system RelE/ParE family toxin [Planctomycetota bacterium]